MNNNAHGTGRLIHADGDVYDGEWMNDKGKRFIKNCKRTVMVVILMETELNMRVHGTRIDNTDMDMNNGLMVQATKESTKMVLKMVMVCLLGQMDPFTKENFKII